MKSLEAQNHELRTFAKEFLLWARAQKCSPYAYMTRMQLENRAEALLKEKGATKDVAFRPLIKELTTAIDMAFIDGYKKGSEQTKAKKKSKKQ